MKTGPVIVSLAQNVRGGEISQRQNLQAIFHGRTSAVPKQATRSKFLIYSLMLNVTQMNLAALVRIGFFIGLAERGRVVIIDAIVAGGVVCS